MVNTGYVELNIYMAGLAVLTLTECVSVIGGMILTMKIRINRRKTPSTANFFSPDPT
jgi:hypothetical protein